jgi:hypothetical protein
MAVPPVRMRTALRFRHVIRTFRSVGIIGTAHRITTIFGIILRPVQHGDTGWNVVGMMGKHMAGRLSAAAMALGSMGTMAARMTRGTVGTAAALRGLTTATCLRTATGDQPHSGH